MRCRDGGGPAGGFGRACLSVAAGPCGGTGGVGVPVARVCSALSLQHSRGAHVARGRVCHSRSLHSPSGRTAPHAMSTDLKAWFFSIPIVTRFLFVVRLMCGVIKRRLTLRSRRSRCRSRARMVRSRRCGCSSSGPASITTSSCGDSSPTSSSTKVAGVCACRAVRRSHRHAHIHTHAVGFPFLMLMVFLYNQSKSLYVSLASLSLCVCLCLSVLTSACCSEMEYEGRTSDYLFFIVFCAALLLPVAWLMDFLVLGRCLVMSIIYMWSRRFSTVQQTFYFGITFQGEPQRRARVLCGWRCADLTVRGSVCVIARVCSMLSVICAVCAFVWVTECVADTGARHVPAVGVVRLRAAAGRCASAVLRRHLRGARVFLLDGGGAADGLAGVAHAAGERVYTVLHHMMSSHSVTHLCPLFVVHTHTR